MGDATVEQEADGRHPRAWDEDAVAALAARLADGWPPRRACDALGLSHDAYLRWMRRAGSGGPHAAFRDRMLAALAAGQGKTPPGPPTGRPPSPIAQEQRVALLDAIRRGWDYHAACREAGVRMTTFAAWLRLGGYPRRLSVYRPVAPEYIAEPYRSFVMDVLGAESDAAQASSPDAEAPPTPRRVA